MDEMGKRVSAVIRGAEKRTARWEAMRSGVIYLIGMDGSDRVKIGFTTGTPEKRLKQLQTGAPEALRLLAAFPGKESLERQLHKRFADYRMHGEWFDLAVFHSDPVWVVQGTIEELEELEEI